MTSSFEHRNRRQLRRTGQMIIEVFSSDGWQRPEHDGRIIIQASDGRRFKVEESNGALIVQSYDGEMLIHPISRTQFGIENPTS